MPPIQHLGPIQGNNGAADGSQQLANTGANNNNVGLNQQFETLNTEVDRIRGDQQGVQSIEDDHNASAASAALSSSNEEDAIRRYQIEQDKQEGVNEDSLGSSRLLRQEAQMLLKLAERASSESVANMLKQEAKRKEEEADREEQKAMLAGVQAEEAGGEVDFHKNRKSEADKTLGNATRLASTSNRQSYNLGNQASSTNLRALGSVSSASSTGSSSSSTLGRVSSSSSSGGTTSTGSSNSASLGRASTTSSSGGTTLGSASGNTLGRINLGAYSYYGAQGTNWSDYYSGAWAGYVDAAVALLRAIALVSYNGILGHVNPITQIAKNLTNKGLSEQATAYLEAAMVDTAIAGTPANQQIILRKAQSNTIHGEAETNIAYWKEVLAENKQLNKATQDLAKMA